MRRQVLMEGFGQLPCLVQPAVRCLIPRPMTTSLPELGTLGSECCSRLVVILPPWACGLGCRRAGSLGGAWQMAGVGSEGTVDDRRSRERGAELPWARRLAAGDELRAWLAGWELTASEWRGFLRGSCFASDTLAWSHAADERTVLVHVVCSGSWVGGRQLAERLRYGERGPRAAVFRAREHP